MWAPYLWKLISCLAYLYLLNTWFNHLTQIHSLAFKSLTTVFPDVHRAKRIDVITIACKKPYDVPSLHPAA